MKRVFTLLCILFSALTIFPIGVNNAEATYILNQAASSPSDISSIELFILDLGGSPVSFEPPGANNFTFDVGGTPGIGWAANLINPHYLLLQGPGTEELNWDAYLSGVRASQHFYYDFLLYQDSDLFISGFRFEIDGDNPIKPIGLIFESDIDDYDRSPVPEPATMLLLASGLVGLAGMRRKFKR